MLLKERRTKGGFTIEEISTGVILSIVTAIGGRISINDKVLLKKDFRVGRVVNIAEPYKKGKSSDVISVLLEGYTTAIPCKPKDLVFKNHSYVAKL